MNTNQILSWFETQRLKANGHDMRALTEGTEMPFDLAIANSESNSASWYFCLHFFFPFFAHKIVSYQDIQEVVGYEAV